MMVDLGNDGLWEMIMANCVVCLVGWPRAQAWAQTSAYDQNLQGMLL